MVGPMPCFAESVCWDVSPGRALRSHVAEPPTVPRLPTWPARPLRGTCSAPGALLGAPSLSVSWDRSGHCGWKIMHQKWQGLCQSRYWPIPWRIFGLTDQKYHLRLLCEQETGCYWVLLHWVTHILGLLERVPCISIMNHSSNISQVSAWRHSFNFHSTALFSALGHCGSKGERNQ